MRLRITHRTSYNYDTPVHYALQQLRMTPKSRNGQSVLSWDTRLEGASVQLEFDDYHMNHVQLISFEPDATSITINCEGEVELEKTDGIIGRHQGYMPMWLFLRTTPLTEPGAGVQKLVRDLGADGSSLDRLHALSAHVLNNITYQTGQTHAASTAEQVIETGKGVCQDHAHVFIAAARLMGVPARYVSGYLMMDDRVDQDAAHAWVEAHVEGLGWVGFDVSNGISPDMRYVRVATGLDYSEAAPVSGTRFGNGEEQMQVALQVQQ
jgi:transglutaminase-like putative cysteine protease